MLKFANGDSATEFVERHHYSYEIIKTERTLFETLSLVESCYVFLVGKGCSDRESNNFNLIVVSYEGGGTLEEVKKKFRNKNYLPYEIFDQEKFIFIDEAEFVINMMRETSINDLIYRQPSIILWGHDFPFGNFIVEKSIVPFDFDVNSTDWQPIEVLSRKKVSRFELWKTVINVAPYSKIVDLRSRGFSDAAYLQAALEDERKLFENVIGTCQDKFKNRACCLRYKIRLTGTMKSTIVLWPRYLKLQGENLPATIAYEISGT